MKNKVLIKLIVPELAVDYDVFIPVNEVVWKIKEMMLKVVCNLAEINMDTSKDYFLINKETCKIYGNNEIVINTDIRNGAELILFTKK